MTEIEAIEHLKNILEEATEEENSVCYVTDCDKEPLEMAINSLEKQIPKKHDIDIFDYGSGYVCGNCGEFILYMDDDDERFKTNYCCYFGQKIDWY